MEARTYSATPQRNMTRGLEGGLLGEEEWTIRRLTLNLGGRLGLVNGHIPEQPLPAGPWVSARDFAPVKNVPNWRDINPRLGGSYDLFGDGAAALKASIRRLIPIQNNIPIGTQAGVVLPHNPVSALGISPTRTWAGPTGAHL